MLLAGAATSCSDVELLGARPRRRASRTCRRAPVPRRCSVRPAVSSALGRDAAPFAAVLGPRWRRRVAVLRAALELGRRAAGAPLVPGEPMRDAAAVYAHFRGRLPQLEREVFFVLLLDGRNRVRAEVRVSEGTLTAALVHPREVFAPGDPPRRPPRSSSCTTTRAATRRPSAEDAALTERLRRPASWSASACSTTWSSAQGRYVSLAETGAGDARVRTGCRRPRAVAPAACLSPAP